MDLLGDKPVSLAVWLDEARTARGWRWQDLADTAKVSRNQLQNIRRGAEPTTATKRKLEAALEWAPRSIDAILAGGRPTTLAEQSPQPADDDPLTLARRLIKAAGGGLEAYKLLADAVAAQQDTHQETRTGSDRTRDTG